MEEKIYVERMWLPLEKKLSADALPDLLEVYDWALSELREQRKVTIYAISGVGDIWNFAELKEKIFTFLEKGGKQEHIIGPVIAVKEKGG